MKCLTLFLAFTLVATVVSIAPAHAALSPLSVGIVPPVQFPPSDFSVTGARVSLVYGKHRDLYGLDLGVIGNITQQSFVGLGVSGLYNITRGSTTILGLQLAGAANINSNKTHVYGAQIALGVNSNTAASSLTGIQFALANLSTHTDIYGVQVGVYNRAQSVYGFQIGLVNVAKSLHGIQIGLVNFHQTGLFAVSPVINIGF
ncbi:MAG: hypothetical protein AB7G93_06195 [Bdellovibrionales bacterium]